jgi:hypothetical protein
VVLERGWLDVAVDPRRYGVRAPAALVRAMERPLVEPDLTLVLEAAPRVVAGRTAELDAAEVRRQSGAWREVLSGRGTAVVVDAAEPVARVVGRARETVFATLTRRTARGLGAGWVGLPLGASSPRWILPRGPRRATLAAMSTYQPIAPAARAAWRAGRAVAFAGLVRGLPRGEAPPEEVRALLAPHLPRGATIGVVRANHPGRFVATVVGADGRQRAVAKVATAGDGAAALATEVRNLQAFGRLLEPPLRAPTVLAAEPGLVLLEPVRWRPRRRPEVLAPEVAEALGRAFAASGGGDRGLAHGDVAPWNLLRTADGWFLLDWELATDDAPPFYDVLHHAVQGHVLLGRPRLAALDPRARRGPGRSDGRWLDDALSAYARGAGRAPSEWRDHLAEYLRISIDRIDRGDPAHRRAVAARRRLLDRVHA